MCSVECRGTVAKVWLLALALAMALLSACGDSTSPPGGAAVVAVRDACSTAVDYGRAACSRQCLRFPEQRRREECASSCERSAQADAALCQAPLGAFERSCAAGSDRASNVVVCRADAERSFGACSAACGSEALRCHIGCERARARDEAACGFVPSVVAAGAAVVPQLPTGRAADLTALLDAAEIAVVEAADRRAEGLRSRRLRLWTGAPDARVRITQLQHDFRFGFPIDFREFEDAGEELAFYGDVTRAHANLMVAETSLKWRNTEPEPDELRFDLADAELAWAEEQGFDVKAHVLLWGNAPPAASGSGTPEWLRDRFPEQSLDERQADELRALIRRRIESVVGRYAGRIDVWEVTNEMLNPLTSWFATRLGPGIVDDAFRWARNADPGAELVYNEWISEIFTGLPGPDARVVRDRVLELLAAGVPVDALGQQGHFAPGLVNVGVDVDLSQRTRVDDYAVALDTLAETGLPIHVTEVTFAAPDAPEKRAAQAEAILRLWWGHPSVEQIVFWNFWNPLGPRSHLNLGIYGDDRQLTRHGEAIVSLLNDRWRTRTATVVDGRGVAEVRATFGLYVAEWETTSGPVHLRFRVEPGSAPLDVIAVTP